MRPARIVGWIVMGVMGATALGFVLGLVVMALWNWLMPAIFGLPEVTYWQAVGLFILCHLLFKGHHGPRGRDHGPPRWDRRKAQFAQRVRERIDASGPPGPCGRGQPDDGAS